MNSKKRLIRHCRVSLGSLDAALVEPREIFRPAIAANAKFIVILHNHPSGDPTPSKEDALLIQQLCMCGAILRYQGVGSYCYWVFGLCKFERGRIEVNHAHNMDYAKLTLLMITKF